jgi:hypothetical protein
MPCLGGPPCKARRDGYRKGEESVMGVDTVKLQSEGERCSRG